MAALLSLLYELIKQLTKKVKEGLLEKGEQDEKEWFYNTAGLIACMALNHIEAHHFDKSISFLKKRHIEFASSFYFNEGGFRQEGKSDPEMEYQFRVMLLNALAIGWIEDGVHGWLSDETDARKWLIYADLPEDTCISGRGIYTNEPNVEIECTKFCIVLKKTWKKLGTPVRIVTVFPYPEDHEPIIDDNDTVCF